MADSKKYQFFQNRQCEYFPCHEVEKEEDFNCLFCYCPLYQKERCLGHPSLLLNEKGQKIKDCSKCELVHRREMYDAVIRALADQDEVETLNVGTLRERIWERMAQIASWDRMDQEMYRTHKAKAVGSIAARMEEAKHLYGVYSPSAIFRTVCEKRLFSDWRREDTLSGAGKTGLGPDPAGVFLYISRSGISDKKNG